MYKILLVDDESWVIESLKDFVEWEQYGFEVIGQASNGFDALDFIRDHRPDVVFTDIRMPEMSGLELIQRGKSLSLPVHYVVISGYAEFAYAQKAMSHGAVAYCLKPYDETEMIGVLVKLKKMLAQQSSSSDSYLIQLLEDQAPDFQVKLEDALKQNGIHAWQAQGLVAVVTLGAAEPSGMPQGVIKLRLGKSKTAFLMPRVKMEEHKLKWLTAMPQGVDGIGISDAIHELGQVGQAIEQADVLAYQTFIATRSGVFFPQTKDDRSLNVAVKELGDAIRDKDSEAVKAAFERLKVMFEEGSLSIEHAFQVYNMTVSFLFNLGKSESMLYSFDQLTQHFDHIYEMLERLNAMTIEYLKHANAAPLESKNQTVNSILDYVRQHFRKDISLQELSEKFHMNPSYISQLFKKEVGENFTSYLSGLRIAYSCELLDSSDSPINEIAEQAGYQDYFYFTRTFKKATGQTPTQYRNRHQE